MWTIKSFQNKKSTHADDQGVTAPLSPPVGDVKALTSSEFYTYRDVSEVKAPPNPC